MFTLKMKWDELKKQQITEYHEVKYEDPEGKEKIKD